MSRPVALVLDFGGVLTTDLWQSIRNCARREGLPKGMFIDLLADDPTIHPMFMAVERGHVKQRDFETHLAATAGVPADGLLARLCADLRPDTAMLDAVAHLRRTGVRVGILSNSWGSGTFDPYVGYDLDARADAVVISDQVGLRKPEPAIFSLILDELHARADETVFVDDVATHLPAAAQIGFVTVHHVDSTRTIVELERLFGMTLR